MFQAHDLLAEKTAGHCNFIFFLREAIKPDLMSPLIFLDGWSLFSSA